MNERVEASIQFLLDQREHRCKLMNIPFVPYEIIELGVTDDTSNKGVVIKVSNAILSESAKSPDFIIVLQMNQHEHSGLLSELFTVIQPQYYCKFFFMDELMANPISNKLVPKHELCTQDMVDDLLHTRSITLQSLPKMLLRDIIARWYGWKVGDVVKITRRDEVYYRMIF
jgi:DNA-directed RNA polymerase subunit H (RpoH/RPB5)